MASKLLLQMIIIFYSLPSCLYYALDLSLGMTFDMTRTPHLQGIYNAITLCNYCYCNKKQTPEKKAQQHQCEKKVTIHN